MCPHAVSPGSGADLPPRKNDHVREQQVIPVWEEQVQVEKQVVETGRVRISKKVQQEEVTVDVPLTSVEHRVERVPVNQFVEAPPAIRYEGDTMIIPVLEEVVVLEKRLKLVEELHVTTLHTQTSATQQVTVQKEVVTVQHSNDNQTGQVNPEASAPAPPPSEA